MFSFRLAAIDLDDTLLGPDKIISPENAAAVQALRERGVHVVLASGRRHLNMLRFHRRLGLSGPIVSCNGAQVKDAETDEVSLQTLVPSPLAEEIIAEGDRLGMTQNYYHTDGEVYVRSATEWTAVYEQRTGSDVTVRGDLEALNGSQALKIIWIDSPNTVEALYQQMAARYDSRLYVTVTDPEYLEFMAPGVNKADGVATVAARLGIGQQEVLAFGDGNNDVPLLQWAGMGIAMSHARVSAQEAADWVTPPGDPETSFARAVSTLFANQFGQR